LIAGSLGLLRSYSPYYGYYGGSYNSYPGYYSNYSYPYSTYSYSVPYGGYYVDPYGPGRVVEPIQPQPQPQVVPQPQPPLQPQDANPQPPKVENDAPAARPSSPQARQRTEQHLRFGDAHFARQDYRSANERYRSATQETPDVPAAWFRFAQVKVALGQHDDAVAAYQRGLALDADWPRSGFRLSDLYGAAGRAHVSHLEALALAAEQDAGNADLYFLLGVQLHFSGQPERAQRFFAEARRVAVADAPHVAAFLSRPAAQ